MSDQAPTNLAPPVPANEPADDSPAQPGGGFVYLIITLVLLLFMATVGSLYNSWLNTPQPKAIVAVDGDITYDQMEVTIECVDHPMEPDTRKLTAANKYSVRFYIEPGTYSVMLKQKGEILDKRDYELRDLHTLHIRLPEEPRK